MSDEVTRLLADARVAVATLTDEAVQLAQCLMQYRAATARANVVIEQLIIELQKRTNERDAALAILKELHTSPGDLLAALAALKSSP